jgi:ppGpp synthetase/RelA/SpoT-type nucleotidyltranferase
MTKFVKKLEEVEEWISSIETCRASLSTLCISIENIIKGALKDNGVHFLTIQSRIKEEESIRSKAFEKNYTDPDQLMTDIIGLRVIVYLESDVDKVSKIINDCFEIDNLNSIDKRLQDDIDKVGYRSLHLICKLGSTRKLAYEYKSHVKRPFEIQIRTAWIQD